MIIFPVRRLPDALAQPPIPKLNLALPVDRAMFPSDAQPELPESSSGKEEFWRQ
jgi:hypothetical protein